MSRRTGALFVAALFACGASATHADVGERFVIEVRLRVDPSLKSRRLSDPLKIEAEKVWAPYGVRLDWVDSPDAPESAASAVFVHASLEREFEKPLRTQDPAVLGLVVPSADPAASNRRSIRISLEATESVLALRSSGRPAWGGVVPGPELARALGRVFAHEIGHVLLGPPFHAQAGLMRASFSVEDLGGVDRTPFRLTCSGVNRLRNRLRALSGDALLEVSSSSTVCL